MDNTITFDTNGLMSFQCVSTTSEKSEADTLTKQGYIVIFSPETHSIPYYVFVRERSELVTH